MNITHRTGISLTLEYYRERDKWIARKYEEMKGIGHYARVCQLINRYGAEFENPWNAITRILNKEHERQRVESLNQMGQAA